MFYPALGRLRLIYYIFPTFFVGFHIFPPFFVGFHIYPLFLLGLIFIYHMSTFLLEGLRMCLQGKNTDLFEK